MHNPVQWIDIVLIIPKQLRKILSYRGIRDVVWQVSFILIDYTAELVYPFNIFPDKLVLPLYVMLFGIVNY